MPERSNSLELTKVAVAVVLTFVAGYVDAIGWLSLDRVFTAQMSGNMVLLATYLATGEAVHAWLQADALAAFFAGLVVTGAIIEIGMRQRLRRIFVAGLAVEGAMLAGFALAAHWLSITPYAEHARPDGFLYLLIAVVGFAMGAQNTSLRMAGVLSVFTTHFTGAVSALSEELIVCGFALLLPKTARRRGGGFASRSLRERHPDASRNIVCTAALLVGFFGGALAGATLVRALGVREAMIMPLVLLTAVGVFDWLMPLTDFPSPVEQE